VTDVPTSHDLQQALDVAHQAIGDDRHDPLVPGHRRDVVAEHRGALIGAGRQHDHIAGLRDLDRDEQAEVVARPAVDRHCGCCERNLRPERLDPIVDRALAVLGVDHEAGRHAGEGGQLGGVRAAEATPQRDDGRVSDHRGTSKGGLRWAGGTCAVRSWSRPR
jgi:hypothetical protein